MGYEVTAHYHSDNDLTTDIRQQFPAVYFAQADFADKTSFLHFSQEVLGRGPFDVIVNAAVCYVEAGNAEALLDWDAWQKNFAVNTTAVGMLTAQADRLVNKSGVIVNISSTYGQAYMAEIAFAMYSASKAALDSLTMSFAKRLAPDIRVVGIAPGWIKSAWNIGMSEEAKQAKVKPQLTQEWVQPEEIADLMEIAVKNKSINATTLVIDGGLSAPVQ